MANDNGNSKAQPPAPRNTAAIVSDVIRKMQLPEERLRAIESGIVAMHHQEAERTQLVKELEKVENSNHLLRTDLDSKDREIAALQTRVRELENQGDKYRGDIATLQTFVLNIKSQLDGFLNLPAKEPFDYERAVDEDYQRDPNSYQLDGNDPLTRLRTGE